MGIVELLVIAVGLGMDAFAIAICKGLSIKKIKLKHMLIVGAYFGGFQALMPAIGYLLGFGFHQKIEFLDHWIAFILLSLIGINMIKEALFENDESLDESLNFKTMLILSIATSIDALAAGITFAFLNTSLFVSVIIIGIITFILSVIGVKLGNIYGSKYQKKACIFGGIVLILLGIKIFFEHLGIINF